MTGAQPCRTQKYTRQRAASADCRLAGVMADINGYTSYMNKVTKQKCNATYL